MHESGNPSAAGRADLDESSWSALNEVTTALENLADILDGDVDLQLLLNQVCQQVTQAVAGVDEATVTLLDGGEPRTAATTSESVAELDRNQYSNGEGPCVRAARTGQVVRTAIDDPDHGWPQFADAVRDAGYGSVLSAPLVVAEEFAGAVNCYSKKPHGLAYVDRQLIELYTTAVEAVLRTYHRYAQAREAADNMSAALVARAVIDQAKGILIAVHKISADEAFTMLARQSQRENVKVRDIAERLVNHAANTNLD